MRTFLPTDRTAPRRRHTEWRPRLRAVSVLAVVAGTTLLGAQGAHATELGTDGCPAEYWVAHTSEWQEYTPSTVLDDLFDFPDSLSDLRSQTMASALTMAGDNTSLQGSAQQLMHNASAAYLNAADESLGYPFRRFTDPFFMERRVNDALAAGDVAAILVLSTTLDTANHSSCPLAPELSQAGPLPGTPGSGSPAGDGGTGSITQGLPSTGGNVTDVLLIGVALCAIGGVALFAARDHLHTRRVAGR